MTMEGLLGVSKTFRALIYKAHRAVISVTAQLSCQSCYTQQNQVNAFL